MALDEQYAALIRTMEAHSATANDVGAQLAVLRAETARLQAQVNDGTSDNERKLRAQIGLLTGQITAIQALADGLEEQATVLRAQLVNSEAQIDMLRAKNAAQLAAMDALIRQLTDAKDPAVPADKAIVAPPRITAPSNEVGAIMTRHVTVAGHGWAPKWGRWSVVDGGILGAKDVQTSAWVPHGGSVIYEEGLRNAAGLEVVATSAPFGPFVAPPTLTGAAVMPGVEG
jgi:hypothetical protein